MATFYRVYRKNKDGNDTFSSTVSTESTAIMDADYFMERTGDTHYVVTVVDGRKTDTVYVVSPQ